MKELPSPTMPLSSILWPRGFFNRSGTPAQLPPTAHSNSAGRNGIAVSWARTSDDVRQAQRLRFNVFATEMGARLDTTSPGHDVDIFDDYCEHLLVRDVATGAVVGTYRVLTPTQAARVGSTYSDTEFDLVRLRAVRDQMVELGRSCVHPDYRNGGRDHDAVGCPGRVHGVQQL